MFSLKSQEAIYIKNSFPRLVIICSILFIKYSGEHIYAQFPLCEKFFNPLKKRKGEQCNTVFLTSMY